MSFPFRVERFTSKNRPHESDWSDADHYLYLILGEKPSAYLGWCDVPDINQKRTLWTTVIQGVFYKEEPKPTPPLGWELELVKSLEELAKSEGVRQIAISPANSLLWYNLGEGNELENKRKRLVRRYDLTAQKSGYSLIPVVSKYTIKELYIKSLEN